MKTTPAACLICLATLCLHAAESWHFLPNFQCDVRGIEQSIRNDADFFGRLPAVAEKLLSADSPLTEKQRGELHWHRATFPHRGFVSLMPERNVYGWYGCLFDIPEELRGMDVLADLGIIDDTDETFVNSVRIGGIGQVGKPHGTAWRTDRLYRIAADGLAPNSNFLAMHVWSRWGLGGIVGPPVLKAAVAPLDAQWDLTFVKDSAMAPDGLNHAPDAESALAAVAGGTPLEWSKVPMPWQGFAAWPDGVHYAVFRLKFDMLLPDGTPRRLKAPVVMDIGAVFDVAAFYLNGRRIGLTGRFPDDGEPAFTEAAQRGQFIVNPSDWSPDGHNKLVAIVYRERGVGGLPGVPGILLDSPLSGSHPSFSERSVRFNVLLQSSLPERTGEALDNMRPATDTDRAWLLSHRAHLAFLKWLDGGKKDDALLDGVLVPVAEILSKYPAEAPKQSAMQAFCRVLRLAEKDEKLLEKVRRHFPKYAEGLRSLGEDRETQGDWLFHYGNAQFLLCSMGQLDDWRDMRTRKSAVRVKVFTDDYGRRWLANANRNVSSPEALIKLPFLIHDEYLSHLAVATPKTFFPVAKDAMVRRAGWWDDHGEMHPFDDEGPDLGVTVTPVADGLSRISWYFNDFDWRRTTHPRQQSMLVTNGEGALLAAVWIGKPDDGVYLRHELDSPQELNFRFNKHRGACVAVSAMFVDEPIRFADTPLHNEAREAFYRKYSEREAKKRLGKLPPEAAFLFAMVLEAERSFSFHPARERYIEGLCKLESPEALTALLDQLARVDRLHLAWLSLAVARLRGAVAGVSTERQKAALQEVFTLCRGREWENFRYAISAWWEELGLPQDDPFYRQSVSRYQTRPNKSKGGNP